MSFLQRTEIRRHWLLILLLLVLIYLVYLLVNQLHPPLPFDPCTTDCPTCDPTQDYLDQNGVCYPTTQTVKNGCSIFYGDICHPPVIICFDKSPLSTHHDCNFELPPSLPSSSVVYFNDGIYYGVSGPATVPASCSSTSVCYEANPVGSCSPIKCPGK